MTTAGASVGAFISGRFGLVLADRSEITRRRREAADEVIETLSNLRRLMRNAENSTDFDQWASVVSSAYDAVDDARHRLPRGWRHLKRSLRAAIGEAVGGVAMVDLRAPSQQLLGTFNHRWVEYALEYIDLTLDSTRRWRDAKPSMASKINLLSYDDWLAKTERYIPGGGQGI